MSIKIRFLWLNSLFLAVLFLLVSPSMAGDEIENLVSNPDFDEGGIFGWNLGTGGNSAGEMTVERNSGVINDCAYVKIDAVGPDAWNPEIHSPEFDVEAGEIYTVSFWAKTEDGMTRTIGVKFEQLDTWVGPAQNFTLTDEWTEYHFSPTMTMSSPPAVVIHIQFNNMKGDVWLDHFRVYQGEYVEDELSEGEQAVKAVDKLTIVWGQIRK